MVHVLVWIGDGMMRRVARERQCLRQSLGTPRREEVGRSRAGRRLQSPAYILATQAPKKHRQSILWLTGVAKHAATQVPGQLCHIFIRSNYVVVLT